MRLYLSLLIIFWSPSLKGQDASTLTFKEYMTIVNENHPVMYQAQLLNNRAESNEKMARGGFDPKLEADWDQKAFENKDYYSLFNSAIKVPSWYGIEFKAGYDRNSGVFLNESDFLPARGLWNAGISVPLGKGLVIDQRRAELKRAEVFNSVTIQEQELMINELLYSASMIYLDWQVALAFFDIAQEGLQLASTRLEGTRSSFINGDKPAIDTLEAFISLQNRELDYQKALQSLENSTLAINNYLWINGEVPLELAENTLAEPIRIDLLKSQVDSLSVLQDQWLALHPELLLYKYKLSNIDIDQRLAKEDLKPNLRVNYNPLVGVAQDALFDEFNIGNYKFGATFSYSILQRKERGKLELVKLKRQETEFDRIVKKQELSVYLNTYINNINQTQEQYELLNTIVTNFDRMLKAENRKFEVGESSIFLVNSRERKYLESRYKLVQASQKLLINRLTYLLHGAQLRDSLF